MIKKMKRNEYRQYSIQFLTSKVRKGPKYPLKYIKIINNKDQVECLLYKRSKIEKMLIEQNTYHQKKVLNTQAYNDKIHKTLLEDTVRDRILNGKLNPE